MNSAAELYPQLKMNVSFDRLIDELTPLIDGLCAGGIPGQGPDGAEDPAHVQALHLHL